MSDTLPDQKLIPEAQKVADMFCISSMGLCGGNDLSCNGSAEIGLLAVKVGSNQLEMRRYALDMEGFCLGDNFLIIAVIATTDYRRFPMIYSGVNRALLISLPPFDPPL